MSEELQTYNEGLPVLADDTLIQIAKQAEARIDAVIRIKQMALKVTNASDWTDQQGKPYLQASGSEKVANLFNISWRIEEPTMETEADGTITYIYRGQFTLAGRSIEVEGSRSSRDSFFKKYEYDNNNNKVGEKPLDRRDLKMAAMTNLLGNGITRLLGIRNLTWEDLKQYAGINQDMVKGKVEYKNRSRPAGNPPQAKSGNPPPAEAPAGNPPPDPNKATDNQLKLIHKCLNDNGIKQGEDRHKKVAEILGLASLESFSDLTKQDASKVIEAFIKGEKAE